MLYNPVIKNRLILKDQVVKVEQGTLPNQLILFTHV